MRFTTLAFIGAVAAAPTPAPQDLSALLGSLGGSSNGPDLGALLGGLTGGAGGAGGLDFGAILGSLGGAGGAGGPDLGALLGGLGGAGGAGGLDFGALLGGLGGAGGAGGSLDFGALLGGFAGAGGNAQTIIEGYAAIKEKVQGLDTFVSAFNVSVPANVIETLDKDTAAQVTALKDAASKVDKMAGAIGIMDALSLQEPGGALTTATLTSIENLKKAKSAIAKVPGAREAELKNLNSLLEATKAFNEAVNKKLPALAVTIAQGEAQKSVDALTDAIAEYSKS